MLQRLRAAISQRAVPIDRRLRETFVRRALNSDREPDSVVDALEAARDEVQRRYPRQARRLTAAEVDKIDNDNLDFAVKLSLEGLGVQRPAVLEHELKMRGVATAAVRDLYGESLDDLRVLVVVAREACERFHEDCNADSAKYEALARLSARAFLIADEILELLAGGFPSGALARWRSLHEVSVVATVLADNDEETARRYLDHEIIGRAKAANDYHEYGETLGEPPLEASVLEDIRARRQSLLEQYGKRYNKDAGWAAHLVPDPNFRSLEALARRDWLRPYYSLANHPVHAGSGNVINEIGVSDSNALLTGATAYGLTDPIQLTAVSLTATVIEFFTAAPDGVAVSWTLQWLAIDELATRLVQGLPNIDDVPVTASNDDVPSNEPHVRPASLLAWPDVSWADVTQGLNVQASLRRGRRVYRRSYRQS